MVSQGTSAGLSQRAPDSGWGWLVLFGTILVNILVIGHSKSCGVYFQSLMQELGASPSDVAWIHSLQFSMFSFLGISLTLTFTPGITMIAQYFHHRRGLANGLMMAGNAFGGIVMPFLAQQLLHEYSLQGCFLIMGALLLNSCVGVMLWQPIEWHQKKNHIQITVTLDTNEETFLCQEQIKDQCQPPEQNGNFHFQSPGSTEKECVSKCSLNYQCNLLPLNSLTPVNISVPDLFLDNSLHEQSNSTTSLHVGSDYLSIPNDMIQKGSSLPHLTQTSKSEGQNFSAYGITESLPNVSHQCSKPLKSSSFQQQTRSSFIYVSSYSLGPPVGAVLTKEHLTSSMSMNLNTESKCPNANRISQKWISLCFRHFVIDKSIFEKTQFYMLTVSLFFHALGYPGTQIFLPYRATKLGFSNAHSASLLSALALADLIGRVCCAWISDFYFCPRKYWFIGGMFTSGLLALSLPFYKSYTTLLMGIAGFGFCCGAYIGLVVVLFADIYAPDKVALAYSISTVIGGIMSLAGPPIIGYVLEWTGSYLYCQLILGLAQCAGATVWLTERWIDRYLQRKRKLENQNIPPEREVLF
ncbi:uncharacterized protein LOC129219167 [Uloborus diversus]|uniref:uncharacterized protein LOC129219167 n=1 Tax=Uloborus diversus TaxID=327109 RepID=UPI002409B635|nr:uncharacterized protein LOC129219167 [Uloborus diversus]